MTWLIGLAFVLAATGLAATVPGLLFNGRVANLRERLIASQQQRAPVTSVLPELMRAYAVRAGGRVGAPAVFHARQEATLATSRTSPPIPVVAEQWTGTVIPGIVWSAKGSMNGLPVVVFDSYVDGRGELSARVLGAIQVAGGAGADFDKGELMRYLSELPVYPDAIMNGTGLAWRQLDPRTVEVTAQSASGPASVRFIFDEVGDIARLESDDRPMAGPGGTLVPTPWHGLFGDYRQFGRYRIPAYGEVGWVLPDGLFTYWHGRLVQYGPLDQERSAP